MNSIADQVRSLIAENDIDRVFILLENTLKDKKDKENLDRLAIIKSSYIRNNKKAFSISQEEKELRNIKINEELLQLNSNIEQVYRNSFDSKDFFRFLISLFSSTLLIIALVFIFSSYFSKDQLFLGQLLMATSILIGLTLIFQLTQRNIYALYAKFGEVIFFSSILYIALPFMVVNNPNYQFKAQNIAILLFCVGIGLTIKYISNKISSKADIQLFDFLVVSMVLLLITPVYLIDVHPKVLELIPNATGLLGKWPQSIIGYFEQVPNKAKNLLFMIIFILNIFFIAFLTVVNERKQTHIK